MLDVCEAHQPHAAFLPPEALWQGRSGLAALLKTIRAKTHSQNIEDLIRHWGIIQEKRTMTIVPDRYLAPLIVTIIVSVALLQRQRGQLMTGRFDRSPMTTFGTTRENLSMCRARELHLMDDTAASAFAQMVLAQWAQIMAGGIGVIGLMVECTVRAN